jgi:hypothetical protein
MSLCAAAELSCNVEEHKTPLDAVMLRGFGTCAVAVHWLEGAVEVVEVRAVTSRSASRRASRLIDQDPVLNNGRI